MGLGPVGALLLLGLRALYSRKHSKKKNPLTQGFMTVHPRFLILSAFLAPNDTITPPLSVKSIFKLENLYSRSFVPVCAVFLDSLRSHAERRDRLSYRRDQAEKCKSVKELSLYRAGRGSGEPKWALPRKSLFG